MSAEVLSGPEKAVFEFVANGRSDRRILEDTGLSQAEFNDVLKQLFGKLGVSSRVELILFAYCEPASSKGSGTDEERWSVEQHDGTAQQTTLSDATARTFKGARGWAA